MKKTIKLPLLALFISLSIVACKGNGSGNSADSAKVDSSTSIKSTTNATVKVDTVKPADTSKMKMDTVSKSTQKTEVKKTVVKKN